MDPHSTIMSAFQTAPNLAEIWPFPINALSIANQDQHITINHHLLDHTTNHGGRKRRDDDESAKGVSTSGNALSESDSKRRKTTGSNENGEYSGGGNSGKSTDQPAKPPAEPLKDYIHVRARRGQATDSHSLAERARREKISERMKILQDLVPGCNKVIGKALVLDEIINYVQSLQRQVEFLSMKLEAVNTGVTPTIEGIPTKDFGQQTFETTAMAFGSQGTREYAGGTSPDWLHMQIGGGFERTT